MDTSNLEPELMLWEHVHPATLAFRDERREAKFSDDFNRLRYRTDVSWGVFGLLYNLMSLLTMQHVPGVPRSTLLHVPLSTLLHVLLRALPSVLVLSVPRASYQRLRPRMLVLLRAVRLLIIVCTVFGPLRGATGLHAHSWEAPEGQWALEWRPAAAEALLVCMVLPFSFQLQFKHHLLWDTLFSACVVACVCAPGGLCHQATRCPTGKEGCREETVFQPIFSALASFVRSAFHVFILSEGPSSAFALPPPRCAPAALALLLLGGVMLRSGVLYCLELHSRSLALRAQGLHVARGDTLVAYFASQHAVLLLVGVAAFCAAFATLT